MNRLSVSIVVLVALAFAAAWAADINGKWHAEYTTPDGQARQTTFTFKVEGETLTGTAASAMGEVPIQDGKASGDTVAFSITRNFNGNDMKINYKGKVEGDEMKLNVTITGMDAAFDITAKRVK